ncbi:hypothetical protein [Nocardia caishijiensis]|uniref:Uncharacterized protein n=1 Tax=Nocardia caishijiensis TaxID=184756 RepID=A0ABQ6YGN3_9NOCA|nr:hypothetical protein [Nocardia caishijiensis]KAF0842554.1 hypothetical protein FNL39_111135 [Nocardia caishijiensis]
MTSEQQPTGGGPTHLWTIVGSVAGVLGVVATVLVGVAQCSTNSGGAGTGPVSTVTVQATTVAPSTTAAPTTSAQATTSAPSTGTTTNSGALPSESSSPTTLHFGPYGNERVCQSELDKVLVGSANFITRGCHEGDYERGPGWYFNYN